MIEIDCSEMTFDEQLALASSISDGLPGKGVALVKDASIVIDSMLKVNSKDVVQIVKDFVSKRKDAGLYEVEVEGDDICSSYTRPSSPIEGQKGHRGGSST